MSYEIKCRDCGSTTVADNIVELVQKHVNQVGRFVCSSCQRTDTFIYRESKLQEEGETWKRWIKGVITLAPVTEMYCPYIFLTAQEEDKPTTGLHFHYFKDTRSQPKGRLKHGHGPGGPPVLENNDMFAIIKKLVHMGVFSADEIRDFAKKL